MIGVPWDTLNELAHHWLRYITSSLLDATVGLILVMFIWLVVRNRVPARWSYLLFLFVPLKLIIPFNMPVLSAPTFASSVEDASQSETVTTSLEAVAAATEFRTSPSNGEPVPATKLSTRTFNMALTPGEPRQQFELETRLYPVHDILPAVQQIDLSHTALSDAGLEKLMQAAETMQRYFGVDVRQTKVTPATVNQLRKEHPRCRIEF